MCVATHFKLRLLGLSFLAEDEAMPLLIPRCRSIHTFGMRFNLDVLFLAEAKSSGSCFEVVSVMRGLGPRRVASCRSSSAVLELPPEIFNPEGGEFLLLKPLSQRGPKEIGGSYGKRDGPCG